MRPIHGRELIIVKFVSSICCRDLTIWNMAICAKRLGLPRQRPKENNSKVNLAKCCCSNNDVIRRHRTWWQLCSGTRCDQRDPKVTSEFELSFGWKIKVRELFNELMSTYVSNAELQKAQNVTEVIFLKRQSWLQSEQSGTPEQTSFGKTYKREASLWRHWSWQKT